MEEAFGEEMQGHGLGKSWVGELGDAGEWASISRFNFSKKTFF